MFQGQKDDPGIASTKKKCCLSLYQCNIFVPIAAVSRGKEQKSPSLWSPPFESISHSRCYSIYRLEYILVHSIPEEDHKEDEKDTDKSPKYIYFFQIKRCNELDSLHHKSLQRDQVLTKVDDVLHYQPVNGLPQKFLPSNLEDTEKSSHNIPLAPTTQTAENVGFVITCIKCTKPRLLHSKNKIKKEDLKGMKRPLPKLTYMCVSGIAKYLGMENNREKRLLKSLYVRKKISCLSQVGAMIRLCRTLSEDKYPFRVQGYRPG